MAVPAGHTVRGRWRGEGEVIEVTVAGTHVARVGVLPAQKASPEDRSTVLSPPLLDIQVNGAKGISLQSDSLSTAALLEIDAYMQRWGVSAWIPTLITGNPDTMEYACSIIGRAMGEPGLRKSIPGIHLEGPHISPEDGPRGAHPREWVCPPDVNLLKRFYRAAQGKLRYVTLSPEWPEALGYIRAAREMGIVVSLGHHNADAPTIRAAVDAGATLSTHLGNGSAPQMPRHHNPLWPQLAEDRLFASMIADAHHLPPETLKTFVRAKTPARTILVSDCVDLTGCAPGEYSLFGAAVELLPSGKICLKGTELLAGSGLMLLSGVVNAAALTDCAMTQAIASATSIPARVLDVRHSTARPREGGVAHFIAFTPNPGVNGMDNVRMKAVYIRGKHASTADMAPASAQAEAPAETKA
ncbi:MAG: amidohydrolase family protein [Candidatus Hydrogenedentes bacterium]|nr:amidohydrolase family protein [Candidatus Hydrogenedentota bacterium]